MAHTAPSPAREAVTAAPVSVHPSGDPAMLGLPAFVAGAVVLGLAFIEYVSAASAGAPLAVVLMGAGLGLLVATMWAARAGLTVHAAVFGVFAGFWLSYGFLLLGLAHNWYGIAPADTSHTVAMFLISWLAVVGGLTLATLALPAAYTLWFLLMELALALNLSATLDPNTTIMEWSGYAMFASAAVTLYLFVGAGMRAGGSRSFPSLPMGRSVLPS